MKTLDSVTQLTDILAHSHHKPVAIFKHSTRCGISRMVYNNFQKSLPEGIDDSIDIYYLDLLSYRDVSNAIAEQTGVSHESPQLLVIKKGVAVHHSSHSEISVEALS